jgi:hypothetical protein
MQDNKNNLKDVRKCIKNLAGLKVNMEVWY